MKKCPYCAEEIQDEAIVCRFCGRDLPGSPFIKPVSQSTTRSSSQVNTISSIIIVLLVILGLWWIGIGTLQLGTGILGVSTFTQGSLDVLCFGIWNWGVSIINLLLIRDVVRRYRSVVNNLTFLGIVGSLFGFVQLIWLGAWLQVIVIPIYGLLGLLAQINKEEYTELKPSELKKVRAKAGTN